MGFQPGTTAPITCESTAEIFTEPFEVWDSFKREDCHWPAMNRRFLRTLFSLAVMIQGSAINFDVKANIQANGSIKFHQSRFPSCAK